jgi:hypothetical protein
MAMFFDNRLTDDDMQRVHDICPDPPPALLMAGSFAALLEAIDTYTQETVHPVTSGMLGLTDREKVILGLYYRSVGFCRTAIELKSVIHQQSLTSAERSVIELYVDMELVHQRVGLRRQFSRELWLSLIGGRDEASGNPASHQVPPPRSGGTSRSQRRSRAFHHRAPASCS